MRLLPALLVSATVITACAAEAPTVSDETLRAYRSLHRMTAKPRAVDTQFAGLCIVTPESAKAIKRAGPHYASFIHVYMNETAREHFAKRSGESYPPGSIVVKEKLQAGPEGKESMQILKGVGGMIKRAPGYATKNGDWEFFYVARNDVMTRDPALSANCADCHRDSRTDYVFGDFAKDEAPSAGGGAR